MHPEELIGAELFKVFNANQTHHGFRYEEGIVNRLKEPFSRTGSCVAGGFYFTTKEHISEFLQYGVWIRRVYVPFDHPDVEVVQDPEGNKYRSNMLMLGEKCTIEELFSMLPLKNLLNWADNTDQLDIFDHWKNLGSPRKLSEISIEVASSRGFVDVLEWWKNSGEQLDYNWAMDRASANNHVHVLEWWKNTELQSTRSLNSDSLWSARAMDQASANNHVHVLEWWKNSGLECKWSEDAMDWASQNGHTHVLEWWKNSGLECKWNCYAVASHNGHVHSSGGRIAD